MSPDDRSKMGGGMGSMGAAPPGQLEPEHEGYHDDEKPADAESETVNVPITILGGKKFKPGEEVMLKIVNIDEKNGMVELTYSPEKEGEDEEMEETGMDHPALKAMDDAMPA